MSVSCDPETGVPRANQQLFLLREESRIKGAPPGANRSAPGTARSSCRADGHAPAACPARLLAGADCWCFSRDRGCGAHQRRSLEIVLVRRSETRVPYCAARTTVVAMDDAICRRAWTIAQAFKWVNALIASCGPADSKWGDLKRTGTACLPFSARRANHDMTTYENRISREPWAGIRPGSSGSVSSAVPLPPKE